MSVKAVQNGPTDNTIFIFVQHSDRSASFAPQKKNEYGKEKSLWVSSFLMRL
jgi:hypothetical protein